VLKLSNEELMRGAIRGLAFVPFLKWWTFLAVPLIALLEAAGGFKKKIIRRLGVPAALCILLSISLRSYIPFSLFLPYLLILTIGYGIPTPAPGKPWDDKGSWLGRLVYYSIGMKKEFLSGKIVHIILAMLWADASIVLAFYFNWLDWKVMYIMLVLGIALLARKMIKGLTCITIAQQS